jgi:hypothetical protein
MLAAGLFKGDEQRGEMPLKNGLQERALVGEVLVECHDRDPGAGGERVVVSCSLPTCSKS